MTRREFAFVWLGGGAFVGALVFCVYAYLVRWARPAPFHPPAIAVDMALFSAFALHHSVFAHDPIKPRLAAMVTPRLVRSFYVWIASLLFVMACGWWQPIGGEVYRASGWLAAAGVAVQVAGLLLMAQSVRAIDALELAGIRLASSATALQTAGPYRVVRHPLYLGWMLCTWGASHMTGDRMAFASISACYLVVAVPWEERSLARQFGAAYRHYQSRVKWRIVPYIF
jgi:protein-S-isoprenylcysteine O-methyltransferase Ste14